MTTKGSSRKQIIILISINNSERVIVQANNYITNINRLLKGTKFKISVDYIWSDYKRIVITTNKVVASSDMNIVEKYMKELNNVDLNDIISLKLLQSKLYLKLLSIPYFLKDTNLSIIPDIIERVIWINIWDL